MGLGSTLAAPPAPALASTLSSTRRSRPLTPRAVQIGLCSPAGVLGAGADRRRRLCRFSGSCWPSQLSPPLLLPLCALGFVQLVTAPIEADFSAGALVLVVIDAGPLAVPADRCCRWTRREILRHAAAACCSPVAPLPTACRCLPPAARRPAARRSPFLVLFQLKEHSKDIRPAIGAQ